MSGAGGGDRGDGVEEEMEEEKVEEGNNEAHDIKSPHCWISYSNVTIFTSDLVNNLQFHFSGSKRLIQFERIRPAATTSTGTQAQRTIKNEVKQTK